MRVECCGIPLKPKPGLTPISCHAVLEKSAYAPFIKERRMKCINATSLRRKSGQWGTQPWLQVKQAGLPSQLADASRLLSDFTRKSIKSQPLSGAPYGLIA